jgi:kumamolisin
MNSDHRPGRGIPDVAGNADPYSGYIIWLYGQSSNNLIATDTNQALGSVGRTSAVSPLYAGLIAIINATLPERVGYLNPTLYAIGSSLGQDVFVDIADGGNNGVYWYNEDGSVGGKSPGYTAGIGWDACTGWGTIIGSALLAFLQPFFQRSVSIVLQTSTFGQDQSVEVGGVFTQPLFVTVTGLRPKDFPAGGITTLTASPTQLALWAPTIPSPLGTNIQFTPTALSSDDPSLGPEVQTMSVTLLST